MLALPTPLRKYLPTSLIVLTLTEICVFCSLPLMKNWNVGDFLVQFFGEQIRQIEWPTNPTNREHAKYIQCVARLFSGRLGSFLYVRRMYYGIQLPELFSSEWPETFFVGILDLLKYKSIKKKMFVILWLCDSVILWSVTYLTRFLYLNIIQSSPNFAQLFIWVVSRDGFLFFSNFQFLPPQGGL